MEAGYLIAAIASGMCAIGLIIRVLWPRDRGRYHGRHLDDMTISTVCDVTHPVVDLVSVTMPVPVPVLVPDHEPDPAHDPTMTTPDLVSMMVGTTWTEVSWGEQASAIPHDPVDDAPAVYHPADDITADDWMMPLRNGTGRAVTRLRREMGRRGWTATGRHRMGYQEEPSRGR